AGRRRVLNLEPPDTHHLRAPIGWLDLGNPAEAGEEIARIRPELLRHPDVLQARWEICAAGRSWDAAVEVAELLVSVAPERAAGWVHRAYALRRGQQGGGPLGFWGGWSCPVTRFHMGRVPPHTRLFFPPMLRAP